MQNNKHSLLCNNRVRVRDQVSSPLVGDIGAQLAEIQETQMPRLALVWDFKSAHRLVHVHPDDWWLQACTTADIKQEAMPDDA